MYKRRPQKTYIGDEGVAAGMEEEEVGKWRNGKWAVDLEKLLAEKLPVGIEIKEKGVEETTSYYNFRLLHDTSVLTAVIGAVTDCDYSEELFDVATAIALWHLSREVTKEMEKGMEDKIKALPHDFREYFFSQLVSFEFEMPLQIMKEEAILSTYVDSLLKNLKRKRPLTARIIEKIVQREIEEEMDEAMEKLKKVVGPEFVEKLNAVFKVYKEKKRAYLYTA